MSLRICYDPNPVARSRHDIAPVQAVLRTMDTLEVVANSTTGVTVFELADKLNIDKGMASRLLSSLSTGGYVVRDDDSGRYRLSMKLTAIGFRYAHRLGFPAVCQPVLRRLSEETCELVQLSTVEVDRVIIIAGAQSRQGLYIQPSIGTAVSLHATASGKVWLASLAQERAVQLALKPGLKEFTKTTITTVERLMKDLEATRQSGYSLAEGEYTEHVNAIAVPIGESRFGFVVGTVAVSAPNVRFDCARMVALAPVLNQAAREIESIWPIEAVHGSASNTRVVPTLARP